MMHYPFLDLIIPISTWMATVLLHAMSAPPNLPRGNHRARMVRCSLEMVINLNRNWWHSRLLCHLQSLLSLVKQINLLPLTAVLTCWPQRQKLVAARGRQPEIVSEACAFLRMIWWVSTSSFYLFCLCFRSMLVFARCSFLSIYKLRLWSGRITMIIWSGRLLGEVSAIHFVDSNMGHMIGYGADHVKAVFRLWVSWLFVGRQHDSCILDGSNARNLLSLMCICNALWSWGLCHSAWLSLHPCMLWCDCSDLLLGLWKLRGKIYQFLIFFCFYVLYITFILILRVFIMACIL